VTTKEKRTTSAPFRIKRSLIRIQISTSSPKGGRYEGLEPKQDGVKTNLLPSKLCTKVKLTIVSAISTGNLRGISDNVWIWGSV